MKTEIKTKIVIVLEIVIWLVGCIGFICIWALRDPILKTCSKDADFFNYNEVVEECKLQLDQEITFSGFSVIFCLILLLLLIFGYKKKNSTLTDAWFIMYGMITFFLGCAVFYIWSKYSTTIVLKYTFSIVVYMAYRIWTLVVVNQFIQELRSEESSSSSIPENESKGQEDESKLQDNNPGPAEESQP